MRLTALLFGLTFCTAPAIVAQSALDLSNMHVARTPITDISQPDRHEILNRLQIVASQLRAEVLTVTAERAFLVQGTGTEQCSPTGNCGFWILSSDYKILLTSTAQQFKIQPSSSAGYPDIVTTLHNSAYDGDLEQWQFDGTAYHATACAFYTYKNSFGDTYARARITPHPCPHH
jgi:hypothetical protein